MSGIRFDLLRAVRDLPLPPPPPELTPSDKLVLALLAMRADGSGFCWTSYSTIAANGWMAVRTAKTSIGRLVAAGLVEIRVRRVDDGAEGKRARVANGYAVLVKVASEVVQPQHEVVQLPHDLVQPLHEGSAAIAPGVVQPQHGGGAATAHRSIKRSTPDGSTPEGEAFGLTPETPASAPGKRPNRSTKSKVPGSDAPARELAAWCSRWGIPSPSDDSEAVKMLDHFRAKGQPMADWSATWRNWQRRAGEFGGRTADARLRNGVQPVPATGRAWKVGDR